LLLGLALARPLEPRELSAPSTLRTLLRPRAEAAEHVRGIEPPQVESKVRDSELHVPVPVVRATAAEREPYALPPVSEIARAALDLTVYLSGPGAYGAGILLDREGHVLTCRHVIEGLDPITVSLANGEKLTATVLDSDAELDLALLKVEERRTASVATGSITGVETGDELFAMGAPRKMKFSLTRGMASFVGRAFDGVYYLQSDLPLNGGSSGGPILDRSGRVVAISSFVLRNSEGLSFALPIDYAYQRFARWLAGSPALEGERSQAFEGWLSAVDKAHAGASEE
jgi:S1-C subfamily serine protease